jgi:hypothetical protein
MGIPGILYPCVSTIDDGVRRVSITSCGHQAKPKHVSWSMYWVIKFYTVVGMMNMSDNRKFTRGWNVVC